MVMDESGHTTQEPDPESVADAVRRQEAADLDWILSDHRGQRVLMRILERTQFMQDPFAAESTQWTAHNLGLQSVGKWLWALLFDTDPQALWGALDRYRKQSQRLRDEEARNAERE